MSEIRRSYCDLCNPRCGTLLHIENGKVVKVTGDPDHPINRGEHLRTRPIDAGPHLSSATPEFSFKTNRGKRAGRLAAGDLGPGPGRGCGKLSSLKEKYGA